MAAGGQKSSDKRCAVIYLRVSTEEQVDNYSLDTQADICRKESERRGLQINETFREEGRSAKTIRERPALIEMLDYCRKHRSEIGAVIVYRLDRISRQTADYLAIRKRLAEYDITLISASEPTGDTPTERFVETMLAGFAQMDNDIRGERAKNGMRARFMSGLYNGRPPLGYTRLNGYAGKDAESFSVMKEAWDLMETGTKSLRDMANFLTENGITEKRKGHKETPIRRQTMSRIFRNKFYTGKLVSKQYGIEVQGQHTPMITEETFYRVQAILDGRNFNTPVVLAKRTRNNPDFPLRRIVRCGRCGQSFTGAWSKGKRLTYGYYFCIRRCGAKSNVPFTDIDPETATLLKSVSLKPETAEMINAFLRRAYHLRIGSLKHKRDQADVELKKTYETRQALIQKNLSGVYSDDIFKEQNKILEEKITSIQASKDETIIEKYNLEAITKFIQNKFTNLNQTYQNAPLEQKRVLMCSIFPKGLQWSYPGYSNTQISPFYRCFLDYQNGSVNLGAELQNLLKLFEWLITNTDQLSIRIIEENRKKENIIY